MTLELLGIRVPLVWLAPLVVFVTVGALARLERATEPIPLGAFADGLGGILAVYAIRRLLGLCVGALVLFGVGYVFAFGVAGGLGGIVAALGAAPGRALGFSWPYLALFVVGFAVQAVRGRLDFDPE